MKHWRLFDADRGMALRNTLFTASANRNTAMQGMGGIGKTVLAEAICRDEVVQQAFPDGIFWFAIGKEFPGISRDDVNQFVFALPSLAEQRRIIAKVDELMMLCDQLERKLRTSDLYHRDLIESVLYHLLHDRRRRQDN